MELEFAYNGFILIMEIDELIRSKRKTVAIIITSDARLVVRAPLRAPLKFIQELVEAKKVWIEAKKAEIRENFQSGSISSSLIEENQHFLFLGFDYSLVWSDSQVQPLIVSNNKFIIRLSSQHQARNILKNWYKKQARRILFERVATVSRQTGLNGFKSIRITSARSRWGSCSSKGNLNFSWRLVSAPINIIDYVVIHELVHLKIHNHSKNFWFQVSSLYPNFKEARVWLKQHPFMPDL